MANYTSVYDLPHIADIHPLVNNGITLSWQITMEEGYWIHQPAFGDNIWKTVTLVYPNTDYSAIEICAEADLPEGAEKCGGVTDEPEVM